MAWPVPISLIEDLITVDNSAGISPFIVNTMHNTEIAGIKALANLGKDRITDPDYKFETQDFERDFKLTKKAVEKSPHKERSVLIGNHMLLVYLYEGLPFAKELAVKFINDEEYWSLENSNKAGSKTKHTRRKTYPLL